MPINIPSQSPAVTIDKKLPPLTQAEAQLIGGQIVSVASLMSINLQSTLQNGKSQVFSPRLLNWVEPYVIGTNTWTLFYTEINSNLSVGDRVFIIGGNYDSDQLVQTNKYATGTDGYQVMFINHCQIVLNILYTGVRVYNQDPFDDYIKVYSPSDQAEFDYYSQLISGSDTTSDPVYGIYKFAQYHNNLMFVPTSFIGTTNTFGFNGGAVGPAMTIRAGSSYIDITTDFINDNLSPYLSTNFTNNGKLWVVDTFTMSGQVFLAGTTYNYQGGQWVADTVDFQPMIGKTNFRNGTFNSGTFDGGIYGQEVEQLTYTGDNIIWNTGTLFNTIWESGVMNTVFWGGDSYHAEFDINGLPFQKLVDINNNGFGYTYVFDSIFLTSEIGNGNFFNSTFGTMSFTSSVISDYLFNITPNWSKTLQLGYFESCNIIDCLVQDSEIQFSRVYNSRLETTKSINSTLVNSLFLENGVFTTNNLIQILGYDERSITIGPSQSLYKFYISDEDYQYFQTNDNFYLNGINIANQSILNYFNKRFIFNSYLDSDDYFNGITSSVQLSSTLDNQSLIKNSGGNYTTVSNTITRSSIDVWVESGPFFGVSNVNISDAWVWNSDFQSGIFDSSDWIDGNLINLTGDNHILGDGTGNFRIQIGSGLYTGQLVARIGLDTQFPGYLNIGDPVYVNGLNYLHLGTNHSLYTDYLITNIVNMGTYREIYLAEIPTPPIVITLPAGGVFNILGVSASSIWINRVKINNSNIYSGLMRRQFIENSIFQPNGVFDSSDIDMLNIQKLTSLLLSDLVICNNGNTMSSGFFYNSIVTSGSDIWNDGFVYNSYWNGLSFNGGTFRESLWVNGQFNGGTFYKNQSNPTGSNIYNYGVQEYFLTTNIKYAWITGNFNGGRFIKSNWESGLFTGGQIENSNFISGTMTGGIFGDVSVPYKNTQMWSGTVLGGVIENGYLFAQDITFTGLASNIAFTNSSIFNNGVFGNDFQNPLTSAIWYNGTFNGGQFIDHGQWRMGTFSGGLFTSTLGWTMSDSTNQLDYTWWDGNFTGGFFGNATLANNSTWYTGQFTGGYFQGRVWNTGILISGQFNGSGTYSQVEAVTDPQEFLNTGYLTQTLGQFNYFGLWRDGFVANSKDKFIQDQKFWTTLQRNFSKKKIIPQVVMNNALWLTGTFSHPNGEIFNSVWLDGEFDQGLMYGSSFNPYVTRPTSGNFEVIGATGFMTYSTCIWNNGKFEESSFYYSQWTTGEFISGTAWGMIWLDGTADYMNAYNVYWDGGLWRNGNWNGSPFNYLSVTGSTLLDYSVVPGFTSDIINNIAQYSGVETLHTINAMSYSNTTLIFNFPGDIIDYGFEFDPGWTVNFATLNLVSISQTAPTVSDYFILVTPFIFWLIPYQYLVQSNTTRWYFESSTPLGSILAQTSALGGTTSVFNDNGYKYDITLTVGIANATSSIRYRIGNKNLGGLNYIEQSNLESGNISAPYSVEYNSGSYIPPIGTNPYNYNGYAVYTFTETYYPSDLDLLTLQGRQFEIWLESGGTLAILDLQIERIKVQYYDTRFGFSASYNNQLISGTYGIQSPYNLTSPILIPPVQLTTIGSTGDFISLEFGNGQFNSGVWANGVWNNGWREDDTISTYNTINQAFKINPNTWTIVLNSTGTQSGHQGFDVSGLQPGDLVSIGNLVAIDINENRRLITNYVKINSINPFYDTGGTYRYNQVSFNIQTNFPIRRFQMDSNVHLLYMTKNIWLNGLFLNGMFNNGVWSNGLFQGFPYITEMFNTEWIDGVFNGGHFFGATNSYQDGFNNKKYYNTGLVQNFTFYDNNVAPAFAFNYNSWIDVNYVTYSGVNLNKLNSVYKETPIGFTTSYTENNLYGFPTQDVLSSISNIRDGFSTVSRVYSLGWNYKTYTDYNSPYDYFNDIVNSVGSPGVQPFINDGWTYSHELSSPEASYQANLGTLTSNLLYVSGGYNVSIPQDINNFTLDGIDNIYTHQIPANRYIVIETALTDNLGYGDVLLFYNNYPATYSIGFTPILFADRLISAPVNALSTSQPVSREYFFNKQSLDMQIFAGNTYSISFNNISFIETDMIPFFQIMSDKIGQFHFLKWEEVNENWENIFNPDNTTLQTWENVYAISSTGTGSSNINPEVQDPYIGWAPQINYSDPNFQYLSSVRIGIDSLQNSIR